MILINHENADRRLPIVFKYSDGSTEHRSLLIKVRLL